MRQNNDSNRGRVAAPGLHVVGSSRTRSRHKSNPPRPGFRGCARSRFFRLSFKAS